MKIIGLHIRGGGKSLFERYVMPNSFRHPTGHAACLAYMLHVRLNGV